MRSRVLSSPSLRVRVRVYRALFASSAECVLPCCVPSCFCFRCMGGWSGSTAACPRLGTQHGLPRSSNTHHTHQQTHTCTPLNLVADECRCVGGSLEGRCRPCRFIEASCCHPAAQLRPHNPTRTHTHTHTHTHATPLTHSLTQLTQLTPPPTLPTLSCPPSLLLPL